MDHKFILRLVKGRSSLKSCHIGAVTKLSLCVAADDVNVLDERHPVGPLLSIGQIREGNAEHRGVQGQRKATLEVPKHVNVGVAELVVLEELAAVLLDQDLHPAPQILLLLQRCHIVELQRVLQLRVLAEQIH